MLVGKQAKTGRIVQDTSGTDVREGPLEGVTMWIRDRSR